MDNLSVEICTHDAQTTKQEKSNPRVAFNVNVLSLYLLVQIL